LFAIYFGDSFGEKNEVMSKEKEYSYYVINMPIKGNHDVNEKLYTDFFMFLYNHKKPVTIKGEKAGIIRKCTKTDDGKALFGYVSTFTKLGKNWIDVDKLEMEEFNVPKSKFPNHKESPFYFYPELHRLVILKTSDGVPINSISKYFLELSKSIRKYEFDVFVETSSDIIEEIMNAERVLQLNYTITYTNADIGPDAYEFLDGELKNSHVKSMDITVKSDKDSSIDINKSKILKGATELSKEYGSFEAKIINKEGKRKTIKNNDYPFILLIKSNLSELNSTVNRIFTGLTKHLKNDKR
jgi:hypothetical protein